MSKNALNDVKKLVIKKHNKNPEIIEVLVVGLPWTRECASEAPARSRGADAGPHIFYQHNCLVLSGTTLAKPKVLHLPIGKHKVGK